MQTLKFKSNPIEEFWRFFCDEMQIPFDHLSVYEHKVMKDVFKRSKLLKALPNRKKESNYSENRKKQSLPMRKWQKVQEMLFE